MICIVVVVEKFSEKGNDSIHDPLSKEGSVPWIECLWNLLLIEIGSEVIFTVRKGC